MIFFSIGVVVSEVRELLQVALMEAKVAKIPRGCRRVADELAKNGLNLVLGATVVCCLAGRNSKLCIGLG